MSAALWYLLLEGAPLKSLHFEDEVIHTYM